MDSWISLASQQAPGSVRDLVLKSKMECDWKRCLILTSGLHIYVCTGWATTPTYEYCFFSFWDRVCSSGWPKLPMKPRRNLDFRSSCLYFCSVRIIVIKCWWLNLVLPEVQQACYQLGYTPNPALFSVFLTLYTSATTTTTTTYSFLISQNNRAFWYSLTFKMIVVVLRQVSVGGPGWPQAWFVDHVGFELPEIHLSPLFQCWDWRCAPTHQL